MDGRPSSPRNEESVNEAHPDVIQREKVGHDAQQGGGPAVEALKGEDGRESEGGALGPDMKEIIEEAMRLAYMPPPTFSGGFCGDYWEF